ncbi:hypothetical protein [Nocardiopsis rhodophaea]|uniref:hypothetical protein n=1 Tax=Nocardiopsis rhodophaea TaxID=280238 RepID=UPI0031E0317B
MSDVFEVSMIDGEVAELTGVASGVEYPIGDPITVPAGVLCEVSGLGIRDLAGVRFVVSGEGWRLATTQAI